MHELRRGADPEVPELERVTLVAPDGLEAAFVPGGGMVGTSLRRRGHELLARRRGLPGYLASGSTYGIPLLAPWANRLAHEDQAWDGVRWRVRVGDPGVHPDQFGRAMHGLLAGAREWLVTGSGAEESRAWIEARLDFDDRLDRFASFPFAHRIEVSVELRGSILDITTVVTATGDRPVPLAVGWHPWFAFPAVPRAEWSLSGPLVRQAVLDAERIPTGELRDVPLDASPMGERFLDDVYVDVPAGTEVAVEAGGTRVRVRYVEGYPVAVVFAPLDADVVCIEPMTAPTDPFSGHWMLRNVDPGTSARARFQIEVDDGAATLPD